MANNSNVIIGDFDGDGKDDIFLQGKNSTSTHYRLLSDDAAGFANVQSWQNGHLGQNWSADTTTIVAGDFNHDGRDDLFIQTPSGVNNIVAASATGDFTSVVSNVTSNFTVEPQDFIPSATTFGSIDAEFKVGLDGNANYTIPIIVPPGISGMQPTLSLNYTSAGGNGILGVGWSLGGTSTIHRCPQNYAQDGDTLAINFNANDRLCLDGERLIAVSGAYGEAGTEYRTEQDSFSRIIGMGGNFNSGSAWFQVETKSGLRHEYGNSSDSQAKITLSGASVVTLAWGINKTEDAAGNYMIMTYLQDVANGEHYPNEILYTFNGRAGSELPSSTNPINPNFKVQFNYQARDDKSSGYLATGKTALTKRLSSIVTSAGGDVVRQYQVNYESDVNSRLSRIKNIYECGGDNSCKPANQFSWQNGQRWPTQLMSTSLCSDSDCGGGLYNGYSYSGYSSSRFVDINGDGNMDVCYRHRDGIRCAKGTSNGLDETNLIITDICKDGSQVYGVCDDDNNYESIRYVDVNADGMTDITYRGDNGIQIILSNGSGFDTNNVINTGIYPHGSCLAYDGADCVSVPFINGINDIYWADLNGDALMDMCYRKSYEPDNTVGPNSGIKCFINTNSGNYISPASMAGYDTNICNWEEAGGCNSEDNYQTVTFMDMNADGKADLVYRNDAGVQIHISNGQGFVERYDSAICSNDYDATYQCEGRAVLRYSTLRYADINGDSYPEVCWVSNSGIRCAYGTGKGFGEQILTNICSIPESDLYGNCDDGNNFFTIQFVDLNGDGKADLTYRGDEGVQSWLSTGKGFVDHLYTEICKDFDPVYGCDDYNNFDTINYADVNGDGIADLSFRSNDGIKSFLSGGNQPDYLTTITDGLGNQTKINYKPMTDGSVYTACNINSVSYPETCFTYPINVVSEYQASNGVGGWGRYTYHYSGLRTHLRGLGQLGFSQLSKTDQQTNIVTTVQTDITTKFTIQDAYPDFYPYLGMITYTTESLNGIDISRVINVPTYHSTYAGRIIPYFPFYATSTELERDYITNSDVTKTVIESYYDEAPQVHHAGNLTRVITTTTDETLPVDHAEVLFKKEVVNRFDQDLINANTWHLGRLTSTTVTHTTSSDVKIKNSTFTYNADGLIDGAVEEPGNINLELTTTYSYDPYGNKRQTTVSGNPGADFIAPIHSTTSDYVAGTVNTQNPQIESANALGHHETKTMDARFGVVRYLTGPNGLPTEWLFDNFGRKTKEIRADGTTTTITREFCNSNCPSVPDASGIVPIYKIITETSGNASVTVYYDSLGRDLRTESTSVDGSTIYVDTVYDSLGRISKVSRPYFAGATSYWTYFSYDALNRLERETDDTSLEKAITYAPLKTTVTTSNPSGLDYTNVKTHIKIKYKYANGKLRKVEENKDPTNFVATTYQYDALGNLTQANPPNSPAVVMSYDLRGNKTAMTDPDMGHWEYKYDAFGNLRRQTDALLQQTDFVYDVLDRKVLQLEISSASVWQYDTATMGIGKLHTATGPIALTAAQLSEQRNNPDVAGALALATPETYSRTHSYDIVGRPSATITRIDGTEFQFDTGYDTFSRLDTLSYPANISSTDTQTERLTIRNIYDANGFLVRLENAANNDVFWRLGDGTGNLSGAMNASGQIGIESAGNGLTTVRMFNPANGLLDVISTGANGVVQNLEYVFDSIGNLEQRKDLNQQDINNQDITETFTYDHLNRLKTITLNGLQTRQFDYDDNGNITYNSGFGTYQYNGSSGPHAVDDVVDASNQVINHYNYDANGNLTSDNSRNITYASYNKPYIISSNGGSNLSTFLYGPEHERYQQVINFNKQILYIGKTFERETVDGVTKDTHYIHVGKVLIGTYIVEKDAQTNITSKTRYFHKDHLGSIDVITDELGNVLERLSYSAFGQRRELNWEYSAVQIFALETQRGFTGHEHLDGAGLIHMNGRVYDPVLGRFISADPLIQAPDSTQSYNRYSYVLNNPLSYTDPTGYLTFRSAVRRYVPIIISMVATYYTGQYNMWLGAATAAATTYAYTRNTRAALIAAATAAAFKWVGDNITVTSDKVFAHGLVGGLSSQASGGKFAHGFIAAAFTQAVSKDIGRFGDWVEGHFGQGWGSPGRVIAAAIVGGTASVIGGGKFENGAIIGAFSRAFNEELHSNSLKETQQERMLRENGDVVGYYMAREAAGDEYATTALKVVLHEGFLGITAVWSLEATAFITMGDKYGSVYDEYDVNVMLMNAHAEAVNSDSRGIYGLLHHEQITRYHHRVFEHLGLPRATFGGTPVTGSVWESRVWDSIWCSGCDTR